MATKKMLSTHPSPAPSRVYYSRGACWVSRTLKPTKLSPWRLARALLQLHGTGTVSGLKVQTDGNADLAKLEIKSRRYCADRIGRIIEVREPFATGEPWLDQQTDSDLILAFKGTFILCDVFASSSRACVERRRASRRRTTTTRPTLSLPIAGSIPSLCSSYCAPIPAKTRRIPGSPRVP